MALTKTYASLPALRVLPETGCRKRTGSEAAWVTARYSLMASTGHRGAPGEEGFFKHRRRVELGLIFMNESLSLLKITALSLNAASFLAIADNSSVLFEAAHATKNRVPNSLGQGVPKRTRGGFPLARFLIIPGPIPELRGSRARNYSSLRGQACASGQAVAA